MDKEGVFRRLIKQLPTRFEVAVGPALLCGVVVTVDAPGRSLEITRIQYKEEDETLVAIDQEAQPELSRTNP